EDIRHAGIKARPNKRAYQHEKHYGRPSASRQVVPRQFPVHREKPPDNPSDQQKMFESEDEQILQQCDHIHNNVPKALGKWRELRHDKPSESSKQMRPAYVDGSILQDFIGTGLALFHAGAEVKYAATT